MRRRGTTRGERKRERRRAECRLGTTGILRLDKKMLNHGCIVKIHCLYKSVFLLEVAMRYGARAKEKLEES